MDLRKIKKLIELLEESALNEIEISEGEESVRLSRTATLRSVERTISRSFRGAERTWNYGLSTP